MLCIFFFFYNFVGLFFLFNMGITHFCMFYYSWNTASSDYACAFVHLQDSTGSFVLPFRQVLYSPYPTTHIDVDINTVKQMPPCHEHTYNQRRYMRSELSALWRTDSEDEIPPDTIIHTDETFTPDLWGLSRRTQYCFNILILIDP